MEGKEIKDLDRRLDWDRLDRLGQILADGDDPDINYYRREYRALAKKLIPEYSEIQKQQAKERNKALDAAMKEVLSKFKCPKCDYPIGSVTQVRSGSMVSKCKCGSRFRSKKRKK